MHLTTPHRPGPHARARGFTLIELLTVIAIIGILAAILIPTVGAVRTKAKTVKCNSQLRSWGGAVRLYATENKGRVPLLINLSGDENMRFYDPYFPNANDGVTNAIHPTDYFSVCPSIDRSGQASTDSNRRYYNFVTPFGCKTALSGTNFGSAVLGKDVKYYTIEMAKTPSRLFLMIETLPSSDAPLDGTNYSNFTGAMNTKVKDILVGTDPALIRHGGVINVLFLDGHVSSKKWSDLDLNSLPVGDRANAASFYTL